MVAHERRLESGRADDGCGEDCAHVEARALWAEALAAFGDRAHELVFLRSRASERSAGRSRRTRSRAAASADRPAAIESPGGVAMPLRVALRSDAQSARGTIDHLPGA
jgi:hypothetical protein